MTQRFSERPHTAIHKTDKQRKTERTAAVTKADDEPPLIERARRWQWWRLRLSNWPTPLLVAIVSIMGITGSLLILNAVIGDPDPVAAHWATVTARPTPPPTVTDTPAPQPTRTRFPTETPTATAAINVQPMQISPPHNYGWYGPMLEENRTTQALCHTYTKELCDFGFSAVNLQPWCGEWECEPQRFTLWLRFYGFGRYWYELREGAGIFVDIAPHLPDDYPDFPVCIPALWNIYTTNRLDRLNGLIGVELRRTLLGAAGVTGLAEVDSGIPSVVQLDILDRPPDDCSIMIPEGFPARYLPEWLAIEQ